ncbi:MAG: hypothetical protein H6671_17470 [Anaerolineaceae bacterium]|nr:hypothetical protein [Anaerolineaceae bacterium]
MTTIQQCDIRLVLGRIRPGAAYGWRGDGDDFGHTMEAVDWRDQATTKPQESAVIADWDAYQAEEQEATSLRQTILGNAQSAVGKTLDTLTTAERNALIALLLYKAGGVHPRTGVVQPLADWVK